MELVVVLRASEEQEAIAQSRCLGLTGMDIYIYIHIYVHTNTKQQCNAITCLTLKLDNNAYMYSMQQGQAVISSLLHAMYHVRRNSLHFHGTHSAATTCHILTIYVGSLCGLRYTPNVVCKCCVGQLTATNEDNSTYSIWQQNQTYVHKIT